MRETLDYNIIIITLTIILLTVTSFRVSHFEDVGVISFHTVTNLAFTEV
jgi:hypothetical protein